jgi:hypothetical protein
MVRTLSLCTLNLISLKFKVEYLDSLPIGQIVLVNTCYSAAHNMTKRALDALRRIGADPSKLRDTNNYYSFCCIGKKGNEVKSKILFNEGMLTAIELTAGWYNQAKDWVCRKESRTESSYPISANPIEGEIDKNITYIF